MNSKIDTSTQGLIENHIKFIQSNFSPKQIILFGSRARGDHLKQSDVDLLVISTMFENMNFRKRVVALYGNWEHSQNLDCIGLTPQEFEERKNELSIIGSAYKEGIEI